MKALPRGYELLGAEAETAGGALRRVRSQSDGRSYWLKSFREEYPSEAILRHIEAELRSSSEHFEGPSAMARLDDDRRSWILYDDHAGRPLKVGDVWPLDAFWRVSVPLTRAVRDAHDRGLLFGHLDPECILWDDSTGKVGLTGGVARTERAAVAAVHASAHAAPELVDPASAGVSVAADIYSLGSVFYELLTGRNPLATRQEAGTFERLMRPVEPIGDDSIPRPLAALVQRMLAKSPAERPASAAAVLHELEELATGERSVDSGVAFRPNRVVGRGPDLEQLTGFVARAQEGQGALILISGEPGVGKSALLRELRKWAIVRARPVAQGKFDQFKRGRPYSALLSAFESAIELALANEEAGYQRYRERFAAADRTLLGVLSSDLPQLQHVAGRLPLPPRLGPSETEHRFKRAFRHLLDCLCEPARPLLLMLDDLQWADRATLEVLKHWDAAGLPERFALVCCYREDEAHAEPHVRDFLESTSKVARLALSPLDGDAMLELCAAALPEAQDLTPLASALHRKSRGNPLHAVEILKNLVASSRARRSQAGHRVELEELRLAELSDTVLGLITQRIGEFDALTKRTLTAASCIGPEFSSVLLAVALDEDPSKIADALRTAVTEGIFTRLPEGDDLYTFSHDRTQQAAFALGSDELKAAVRSRLGKHYLKGVTSSRECLFGAVEHLNCVRHALSPVERKELAELNLRAAFLAKESIAYERAVSLFRAFQEDADAATEDARFAASLALAECIFLTSTLEGAEVALAQALRAAPSPDRELVVLQTWQEICQHQQRYPAAIEILLRALRKLGHALPARPAVPRVLWGLARLLFRTRKVTPAALAARPDEASPTERAVLGLLLMLWGPSLWTNKNLNGLVVVRLMTLVLRVGNAPGSAMAYVCYAVLNHVLFGRHELALEYSKLGLAQLERDGNAFVATRVRFLAYTFFGAFERTPQRNIEAYESALHVCIVRGELLASHLLDGIVTTLPTHGFALGPVLTSLEGYERQARQLRAESTLELIELVRHWARAFSERNLPPLASVPIQFPSYVGFRDLLAMQLAYLGDDDAAVLKLARRIRSDVIVHANPLHRALYCSFVVLAQCRARRQLDRTGRNALKTLQRFAGIYPPNFRSLQCIAEAEVARVTRGHEGVVDAYRRAMDEAAAHGHELFHAIAVERLAHFHDTNGERDRRDDCLRAAAFAYARFGAHAKADQLRRRYPELDWQSSRPGELGAPVVDLRVEAVMKAASAIAEETSSERLGPTLVRVLASAASAERATLLQRRGDDWTVLAAWQVNTGDVLSAPVPLEACELVSHTVVRYVSRTNAVVNLTGLDERFADDAYLIRALPRSVLCVPVSHRGDVNAMLYLENSLYSTSFTGDQVQLVSLLGRQAAIALVNSETHRLQIESVQARVNPHFLYNALSVVAELIATSPEQAEGVVLKLSRLYRTMLNSSADRMVTLEQELQFIRDYLELEQARFGQKLRVQWSADTELYPARVPSLLLQPLVENAVHHGIRRRVGGGTVTISVRSDGASLILAVRDDGPGWYSNPGGNGFGLRSVEQRLKLLYGAAAQMTVSHGAGVSVQIQLPLG